MKFDVKETAVNANQSQQSEIQLLPPKVPEILATTTTNATEALEACDKPPEGAKHNANKPDAQNSSADHFEPSVRLLQIPKAASGACGFHLTRSKWDPYPWVSGVDENTPAELCGLKAGDCVLEVNGEDVLGLRITDIAKLVKATSEHVTMLMWSTGWDAKCDPESLCCGPMPRSLQRLSVIVQSILSIIECPVCLDTIPPPAMQCQNGHLLCVNCRIRAEKCPVCRDRYTPRRALIAEQIYNAITSAFNLCRNEDKLRQKLFGPNAKQPKTGIEIAGDTVKEQQQKLSQRIEVNKSRSGVSLPTNKFLAKLLRGKACSMENLTTATNGKTQSTTRTTTKNGVLMPGNSTPSLLVTDAAPPAKTMSAATSEWPICSNQFNDMTTAKNRLTSVDDSVTAAAACNAASKAPSMAKSSLGSGGTLTSPTDNVAQVNVMSKHFSLSANDLSQQQQQREKHEQQHQQQQKQQQLRYRLNSADAPLIAIERCPSLQCLNDSKSCSSSTMFSTNSALLEGKSMPAPSSHESSLLFLDKRRPCNSLNSSVECIRERLQIPDDEDSKRTANPALSTSSYSSNSNSSSSTSSSTSSGVFTSLDSSMSADIKDELLSASAPPSPPAQIATATVSDFQSSSSKAPSSLSTSSSSSSSSSTSSVELSSTPVGTSISADVALELPTPKPTSPFVLEHSQPLNLPHENHGRYRCPLNCGSSFNASSQLQRHVKVEHRLPILSYGGASAQLKLPLQQPLDNAVIILEIENDSSRDSDAQRWHRRHTRPQREIKVAAQGCDESVKSDDNAPQHDYKDTKECWIRIERLGQDVIQASALLQAAADESLDFMMETQLSRNEVNNDKKSAATTAKRMDLCNQEEEEDEDARLQPRRQESKRTRSIVHSMEATTWQETFNQYHCNNNNNGNDNNIDYRNVSESCNANNAGNLSVISIIQYDGNIKDGDLLCNIEVRRIN